MTAWGADAGPRAAGRPAPAVSFPFVASLAAAPTAVLAAPVAILGGAALLVWDYALVPPDPLDHLLYWAALATIYLGIVAAGVAGRASTTRQVVALAVFGALTWLPYFLRSPDRLLFVDERYHLDILQRAVVAAHTSGLEVRLFLLPGTFPALEDVALNLMAWTGLSALQAARVVTITIHAAIPVVAYLAVRLLGLRRRTAFLAALVYAANTSYFFFHSIFSYESIGILLYLSVVAIAAAVIRRGRRAVPAGVALVSLGRRNVLLLAPPLIGAIAIAHHISSYLLVVALVAMWAYGALSRASWTRTIGFLALASAAASAAWFVATRDRIEPYLVTSITDRVQQIVDTLLIEHAQPRALFANSGLPLLERLVAFAYPPLVAVLSALGMFVAWRVRPRARWVVPFALVGPLAWLATTPAVLTRSGELAYRSWPFLFLGVGIFVAIGALRLARSVAPARGAPANAVAFGLVGLLLVGGFSIGDNQAGRFPGAAPLTSAGSGNATADAVAAARWLRATVGEGRLVATDNGNSATFATDGGQRIVRWQGWFPFVTPDASRIVPWMAAAGVDFLVVDRQLTQLPPRYGTYFGEPAIPPELDPGVPFPAALFDRLDGLTGLERIYDSGRITIYSRRAEAPGAAAPGAAAPGATAEPAP